MSLTRTAAAAAAARAAEMLGTLAQAAEYSQRDSLQAARNELRNNVKVYQATFEKVLHDEVAKQVQPDDETAATTAATNAELDWMSVGLVDDNEVELNMAQLRIAQLIAHACDDELQELSTYLDGLVGAAEAGTVLENPLRPEVIATALCKAVRAVVTRGEMQKIVLKEMAQAMATGMKLCYGDILRDLESRKIKPVELTNTTARRRHRRSGAGGRGEGTSDSVPGDGNSGPNTFDSSMRGEYGSSAPGGPWSPSNTNPSDGWPQISGNAYGPQRVSAPWPQPGATESWQQQSAVHSGPWVQQGGGWNLPQRPPAVEAELMGLLRRLNNLGAMAGLPPEPMGQQGAVPYGGGYSGAQGVGYTAPGSQFGPGESASRFGQVAPGGMPPVAENLIRSHREDLVRVSGTPLETLIIDVVGVLFDQVLSDPRVPPQMARVIARLQLPVLRIALADPGFFSTRKHPVRRFVNRLASLACAYDEFDDGPGKLFVARAAEVVDGIVEGEFEKLELYSQKLEELESYAAELAATELRKTGAVETLEEKEGQLRIQQRFMMSLHAELKPTPLPTYLCEFLAHVWSQAIVLASRQYGENSADARRVRRTGWQLAMSVQPKGAASLRKRFVGALPSLMRDIQEGIALVGWSEKAKEDFFGKLLPTHSRALNLPPLTELEYNLLDKKFEAIFNTPLPTDADGPVESDSAVMGDEGAVLIGQFTPEEARAVGLVDESHVDWSLPADAVVAPVGSAPLSALAETEVTAESSEDKAAGDAAGENSADAAAGPALPLGLVDINLAELGQEPSDIAKGRELMQLIKPGFAYEMLLMEDWQTVRLTYVSPGRSFFVFSFGANHMQALSMTSRMLTRMCDTGRLRAVESAYLIERATHRARQQLAALKMPATV